MHAGHGCMLAKGRKHICFGMLGDQRSMWFGMVADHERIIAVEAWNELLKGKMNFLFFEHE